ncbi:MAG: hypothetical protein JW869_08155 [Candidatus Omnitrophica bacterium]|nr:hypothetical protein [Candidatus Omnitrophota bacterium]
MKKALLVIGDKNIARHRPYVSFRKFVEYAQKLQRKKGFELKIVGYSQLFSGKAPRIKSAAIKVILFFPYKYWNKNIERYRDGRIYGEKSFGREFKAYLRKVKKSVAGSYRGKRIEYLNHPEVCCIDRDKKATKDILSKNEVMTPRTFKVGTFDHLQKLIDRGINLYIKPRFGAMGKGITYIDKQKVISNFLFRKGEVVSRSRDFNWRTVHIKDKEKFLNRLLSRGFICEEAITPPTIRERRFDFRVYVMFGKVVYLYAKSSPKGSLVTNWSQGGRIDKYKTILKKLDKKKLMRLKKLAVKAARTLGLNFAGIDIIFSKDFKKAYVLEGNAFPGYEKGFNLMKCLLESVVE